MFASAIIETMVREEQVHGSEQVLLATKNQSILFARKNNDGYWIPNGVSEFIIPKDEVRHLFRITESFFKEFKMDSLELIKKDTSYQSRGFLLETKFGLQIAFADLDRPESSKFELDCTEQVVVSHTKVLGKLSEAFFECAANPDTGILYSLLYRAKKAENEITVVNPDWINALESDLLKKGLIQNKSNLTGRDKLMELKGTIFNEIVRQSKI